MNIDAKMYDCAQRLRQKSTEDSDERMLADAVIAAYRPTRRHQRRVHQDVYDLVNMYRGDGVRAMRAYALVADQHHLAPETVRKICQRIETGTTAIIPTTFHQIPPT